MSAGLGVQVVPDAGFIDYEVWALATGLDRSPTAILGDPLQDHDADGVANIFNFLFGDNGGSGVVPGNERASLIEIVDGTARFEMSYDRPIGTGAAYKPYYSVDLENWGPAAMTIKEIVNYNDGSNLQRVTLEALFTCRRAAVPAYVRIHQQHDPGLTPEQPVVFNGALTLVDLAPEDLETGTVIPSYDVVVGRELYFRTEGYNQGTITANITSCDASGNCTGDYTYAAGSAIGRAAVFQGLLEPGQSGVLKVTFVATPEMTPVDYAAETWIQNNVTANGFGLLDYADAYSDTLALISIDE